MLVALLFVRPVPSSGSAGRHVGESATCGYSRSFGFGFFMDGRSLTLEEACMNVHDTWKPHQAEPGQIGAPRLAPGRGPWPPKYLGKRRIRSAGFVYVIMHNYCWTGRVLQERKMSPNIEIMKTHPHHHHDQYPCGSKVKTDHKFATILSLIGPIVMYQLTANQHFLGQLSHLCSQGATYPGLLQGSRIQAFFTEDWVISIRLEITGIVPQISGKLHLSGQFRRRVQSAVTGNHPSLWQKLHVLEILFAVEVRCVAGFKCFY